jgi:hypothetical protein
VPTRRPSPDRRPTGRLENALALLFRTVRDDAWQPDAAGHLLLAHGCADPSTLRLMRARVSRRLLERPTPLAQRAALTLEAAARMTGPVPTTV